MSCRAPRAASEKSSRRMPHVTVTIAGKSYRMACGEGEESHLTTLAEDLDRRLSDMRGAFGEIGDMRLQVMAALTLVDELQEAVTALVADTTRAIYAGRAERKPSPDACRFCSLIDTCPAAERSGIK